LETEVTAVADTDDVADPNVQSERKNKPDIGFFLDGLE
jgi:hypothetical protein